MANQRKSMNKIREILRLSEDCGLTQRTIEKALGVSRPVVSQYISYFKRFFVYYITSVPHNLYQNSIDFQNQ